MSDIDALFLTKYDRKGPSSRYRSLQYFPYLEEAGVRCSYEPLFSNEYLEALYETGHRPPLEIVRNYLRRLRDLTTARSHDVVVLEKELLPYAPALFERALGASDTPFVVDYDDAVFHNYDRSPNPLVRRLLGRKIDVVMREADGVVAGNQYLASRARGAGASRVEVIPTVIDLDRYRVVPPTDDGSFTIGWIGSPDTIEYVEPIVGALRTTCEETDAEVVLVGSGPVEFEGVPTEVVEWSEETEVVSLSRFDVGVMPISDGPWERGKCGLKLIQYMGCGKPVVASPVGANRSIVVEGETGYFASTDAEWVERLKLIANDVDLARRLGANGRERVERDYCLSSTAPDLAALLESVAE